MGAVLFEVAEQRTLPVPVNGPAMMHCSLGHSCPGGGELPGGAFDGGHQRVPAAVGAATWSHAWTVQDEATASKNGRHKW